MKTFDPLAWKARFRDIALELGFIRIGFTSAAPLNALAKHLKERDEAGYNTPFEESNFLQRTEPQAIWASCQTVVVLAYPLPLTSEAGEEAGILSRSAVGDDYHRVVQGRMEEFGQKVTEAGWPSETPRVQVDTGPLNERAFAIRSGLGWAGRNQQIIIPGVGSFVTLALLLLDQVLPPDEPLANECGTCRNCIQVCPAQILGKENFIANQCVSYLTQSKEALTDEQGKRLGRRLFGCDVCQEACPHNRTYLKCEDTPFPSRGVDLYDVLTLTKAGFNDRFRSTAAGWRGKGVLQRNAYRIMENLKDVRRIQWINENKDNNKLSPLLYDELKRRSPLLD